MVKEFLQGNYVTKFEIEIISLKRGQNDKYFQIKRA